MPAQGGVAVSILGRLHLVTDVLDIVDAALSVGTPVVQVRVADGVSDRQAYKLASRAVEKCAAYGATCLVNDRLHVALAAGAAGGHVGA
jgi:thiamine-phosphate pyrophosphorylase